MNHVGRFCIRLFRLVCTFSRTRAGAGVCAFCARCDFHRLFCYHHHHHNITVAQKKFFFRQLIIAFFLHPSCYSCLYTVGGLSTVILSPPADAPQGSHKTTRWPSPPPTSCGSTCHESCPLFRICLYPVLINVSQITRLFSRCFCGQKNQGARGGCRVLRRLRRKSYPY